MEERITVFMKEAVEKERGRDEGSREKSRGRGKTYYRLQQSHTPLLMMVVATFIVS